jgi:hypothetical protein
MTPSTMSKATLMSSSVGKEAADALIDKEYYGSFEAARV